MDVMISHCQSITHLYEYNWVKESFFMCDKYLDFLFCELSFYGLFQFFCLFVFWVAHFLLSKALFIMKLYLWLNYIYFFKCPGCLLIWFTRYFPIRNFILTESIMPLFYSILILSSLRNFFLFLVFNFSKTSSQNSYVFHFYFITT